jgi:hypothetical protein
MSDNVTRNEYIAVQLAKAVIGLTPPTIALNSKEGRDIVVQDAVGIYRLILNSLEAGQPRP